MVIKSAELSAVCGVTSALPQNDSPQIAFAGRSNVGKSSLINALINRKSFARVSSEPGKTQTINFYDVNREVFLVDLPGYGYARASADRKRQWGEMVERYLYESRQLRAVFLLIDIRHEPSADDRMMYDWIKGHGFAPIIIASKTDKLKKSRIPNNIKTLRQALGIGEDVKVVLFSAVTRAGRDEIWELIETMFVRHTQGEQR